MVIRLLNRYYGLEEQEHQAINLLQIYYSNITFIKGGQ